MQAQSDIYALVVAVAKAHQKLIDHLSKDLSWHETLLLAHMVDWPARTPGDFAKLTGLTKGRITHLLDHLESQKLIERSADPRDKRKTRITLTAEGVKLSKQSKQHVDELYRSLTDSLGQAGTDMLIEQLNKI